MDRGMMDPERVKYFRNALRERPQPCKECLYLKKLEVFQDELKYYITLGCRCGHQILSAPYDVRTEAQLDLSSLSWKN